MQLAEKLTGEFNFKVILIWGGYEEEELAINISRTMGKKPLIAPKTTILEMAALMKRCKVIVCNDSGLLHVAVSQKIPTVSIFGPADEKVYGPYPQKGRNIVITSGIGCRPCYNKFKLPECKTRKCLDDISVDKVFEAVEQIIAYSD
jgi:heptosyltransferase-2